MAVPQLLLKCIARAALGYVGAGPLGDVLVDIAEHAVENWKGGASEEERRREAEAVLSASPGEVTAAARRVADEVAADRPEEERAELADYLSLVPSVARASFRRPSDPTGTSIPAGVRLDTARHLMPFIPSRTSSFKRGDRPIAGVDLELVELLGVGGFGEVWLACDPDLPSEKVALKFCLDLGETTKKKVLRREKKALAYVKERAKNGETLNIVNFNRSYNDPPCLEYEYVDGGDLASVIRGSGGMAPAEARAIIKDLARTVAHFHRLDPPLVHRDLKPANILIQRSHDGSKTYKIADFGIGAVAAGRRLKATSRPVSRSALLAHSLLGSHTPLYASPEQMRGERPDPRDDVHALGVIWHQLLLGDLMAGPPTGLDWAEELKEKGMKAKEVRLLGSCFSRPEKRPKNAGAMGSELKTTISGVFGFYVDGRLIYGISKWWRRIQASATSETLAVGVSESDARSTTTTEPRWFLQREDGVLFGPVSRSQLDRWKAEKRVTKKCQIRREGAGDWRPATQLYPSLYFDTRLAIAWIWGALAVLVALLALCIAPALILDTNGTLTASSGNYENANMPPSIPTKDVTTDYLPQARQLIEDGEYQRALVKLNQIPSDSASQEVEESRQQAVDLWMNRLEQQVEWAIYEGQYQKALKNLQAIEEHVQGTHKDRWAQLLARVEESWYLRTEQVINKQLAQGNNVGAMAILQAYSGSNREGSAQLHARIEEAISRRMAGPPVASLSTIHGPASSKPQSDQTREVIAERVEASERVPRPPQSNDPNPEAYMMLSRDQMGDQKIRGFTVTIPPGDGTIKFFSERDGDESTGAVAVLVQWSDSEPIHLLRYSLNERGELECLIPWLPWSLDWRIWQLKVLGNCQVDVQLDEKTWVLENR